MKKIRIKKISKITLWYADLRGEEFEVKAEDENDFEVINPKGEHHNTSFIFKEDAEIIKTKQ